jgi:hypothetical protein
VLEPDSKSDNYGVAHQAWPFMQIGERLCRCINSAQSRNLRHALTLSASELAAKHCLSVSQPDHKTGSAPARMSLQGLLSPLLTVMLPRLVLLLPRGGKPTRRSPRPIARRTGI